MERKEAIEVVKKNYPHVNVSGSQFETALRTLIPELKESEVSEDERIRKAMIHFFFNTKNTLFEYWEGIPKSKVITWLEKQGKNNMGISEATKKKLEDNLNKALEKETPESFNEFLDEQKSADLKIKAGNWYVCDMEVINDNMVTAFHPGEIYYCPKDGYLDVRGVLFEVGCLDVFRLATEKEIPQPKQNPAWSEEDERILNTVIHNLRYPGVNYYKKPIEEEVKWLKSLKDRVQPQQEWSEEDEDILNTIINHFKIDIECTDEDDVIRWLKSLKGRYTWKPSKEQMVALWNVYKGGKEQAELATLYNDLKKLKG